MSKLKFTKLAKLLKNNQYIAGSVADSLKDIDSVNNFLTTCLPETAHEHCTALRLDHGELVIMVDSPAWKAKLHYLLPGLQQQLGERFQGRIRQIRLSVLPDMHQQQANQPQRQHHEPRPDVSCSSLELIESTADAIDDPELKAALHRLARHRQQKK